MTRPVNAAAKYTCCPVSQPLAAENGAAKHITCWFHEIGEWIETVVAAASVLITTSDTAVAAVDIPAPAESALAHN
jgi:hypothetical protein